MAKIDLEWGVWSGSLRDHLRHRGDKARLAKHLGVTPQRLNHWINEGKTMPGWAVVSIQNYFHPLQPDLFSVERFR
jgi:hypothetical protein